MDDITLLDDAPAAPSPTLTRAEADRLVLDLITRHAESLLRLAHRFSYCADDAHDAYQRAMEILLRHAPRLDPARAGGWIHTVVKHEALAVRRSRQRLVGVDHADLDRIEERTSPSPEERVVSFERVARTAEALSRVKADEARAIWLKAGGDSYAQIGERTGWSYTKVNRCLTEGRKSFLEHFAGIEAGEACERWAPVLSQIVDGEAEAGVVVEARAHLRACASCRATLRGLRIANTSLAAVLPLGAGGALSSPEADLPGAAAGLLARAWEAVTGLLQDRAAAGAVRMQAVLDAATSHKVAAIAASAAAVAGGGVAVEGAVHAERPAPRAAAAAPRPGAAAGPRVPSRPIALRTAASPVRDQPSAQAATPGPTAGRRARVAARRSTSPAGRAAARSSAPAASEPLVDPVESRAPAARPALAPARPPAASSAPDPGPSAPPEGGSGSAPEFGFEAP